MKKLLLSLTLAFIMVFTFTTSAFAAVPDEVVVEPRLTSSINIIVDRTSGTKGGATVDCNFAGTMESFEVSVYLQKLSNGSWVNDTSNEDYYRRAIGNNRSYATFDVEYDKLKYGTSYRVKVVSKTTFEGVTYQRSGYSLTF